MKKIFASTIIAFTISLIFCIPSIFANNMVNDAANATQNAAGGAENATESTVQGATGAIKNGINTVEKAGENTMNNVKNATENTMNNVKNGTNNTEYTAQRTATETNNNFLGFMNNNVWSWIIVGIVALAIVGILWYFMARKNNYSNHDE